MFNIREIHPVNWHALDLNLLRVLDAMLRERNTTRVGEQIGLSQPAVSSALNRLRNFLDDPLFVREGNRMVPTALAESIREPLRQALDQIERVLSRGATFDPARSNRTFRILGDDFLAELVIPGLVRLLAAHAPGMRLQLLPMNPRPLAPQFAEGILDLAFSLAEETPDWVERTVAAHGDSVSVASRRNKRLKRAGLKDRDAIPLALFLEMGHVLFAPHGELAGSEDEALERMGKRRNVVVTVPDFFSVARIAAQTEFLGALPPVFALSVAEQLGLNVYSNPFKVVPEVLYLYWHRRDTDDAEHRWMRERILELLEPLDHVRHPIELVRAARRTRARTTSHRRRGAGARSLPNS
jgi:DNA-binding transcriptional LysR family regulator